MSARAPQAIWDLWNAIEREIPRAQLGGIVGDVAHSFGYHLARRDLPTTDYSVQLPKDKLGPGDAASALDVSLPPDLMIACTQRLLTAARQRDPRLRALREFCGTTDGQHTHPYDLSNGQDGPLDSWDSSHLTHIHLSFYREYADNTQALAPIAEVFTGEEPMPTADEIADAVWRKRLTDNAGHERSAAEWLKQARNFSDPAVVAKALKKQLADVQGLTEQQLETAYRNVLRDGVGS
jgi:hypothetical protein